MWNIIQEWVYADSVKDVLPIGMPVEEALKAVTETYPLRVEELPMWLKGLEERLEAEKEAERAYLNIGVAPGVDYVAPTNEDGVITNSRGGKQTDLKARYDLLPALAVKAVAGVLERGAKKYGEGNWHCLSVEEIHNHTLGHAVAFNRTNNIEDLEHTACRALMALEIALREVEQHERKK